MAVAAGTTVLEWTVEPVGDSSPLPTPATDLYFEIVGPASDELQVELIITI